MAASNKLPEEKKEPWRGYGGFGQRPEYRAALKRQTERNRKRLHEFCRELQELRAKGEAGCAGSNFVPNIGEDIDIIPKETPAWLKPKVQSDDKEGAAKREFEDYEKSGYQCYESYMCILDAEKREEEADLRKRKMEEYIKIIRRHGVDKPSKGDINVEDNQDYEMEVGRQRVRKSKKKKKKKARLPVEEAEKEKVKEEDDRENNQRHGADEPSKGDINDDAVEDKKDYDMDAGRKIEREVPGPSVGEAEKKPVEVERVDNTA